MFEATPLREAINRIGSRVCLSAASTIGRKKLGRVASLTIRHTQIMQMNHVTQSARLIGRTGGCNTSPMESTLEFYLQIMPGCRHTPVPKYVGFPFIAHYDKACWSVPTSGHYL